MPSDKAKVPSVYINHDTHAELKKLAAYQGTTLPQTMAMYIEEMLPVFIEMNAAYAEILSGSNAQQTLNNLLTKGLNIAADKLNEGKEDVTDSGQSD